MRINLIYYFIFTFCFLSCSQLDRIKSLDDQYFEEIMANKTAAEINFVHYLKKVEPKIYSQIESDKTDSVLVDLWGESYNFDSGANKTILDKSIIESLQNEFNIKNDNVVVHAGIMHTYGYLFSTLNTPYGYKRKRWLLATMDNALKLQKATISPHPEDGTLLSNMTYVAGKLSFDEEKNLGQLEKLKNVSQELRNYNFNSIKKLTLKEDINFPTNLPYTIKSTFIKFLSKAASEENDYLLIYSIKNRETKIEKIITAFPIKKDAYLKMIDPNLLGQDRPVIIKNNAYMAIDKNIRLSGNRLILGDL